MSKLPQEADFLRETVNNEPSWSLDNAAEVPVEFSIRQVLLQSETDPPSKVVYVIRLFSHAHKNETALRERELGVVGRCLLLVAAFPLPLAVSRSTLAAVWPPPVREGKASVLVVGNADLHSPLIW
jgi:hypothetical protein